MINTGIVNVEYEEMLNAWTLLFKSDYDMLIFCLLALGYTHEEIAEVCQCTKQNISYKLKTYRRIYKEKIK